MEHHHHDEPSAPGPWLLSDSLRHALDSRVKTFLETLDVARESTSYSKAMNAWGVTPNREPVRTGAAPETSDSELAPPDEMAVPQPEESEGLLHAMLEGDHSREVQLVLAEAAAAVMIEKPTRDSIHGRSGSCTVDGACLRDVWLRGMITAACVSLMLLA